MNIVLFLVGLIAGAFIVSCLPAFCDWLRAKLFKDSE